MILVFYFFLFIYWIQAFPMYRRSSMSGEGTYYQVGMGYCGEVNDDSELVAALASQFMEGEQRCGTTITIHSKGKSVDVKIVDKCPGCADGDIDLSEAAFKQLAPLSDGRIPITWTL